MSNDPRAEHNGDEIYVGYLPVPPMQMRFLRTGATVLAFLFAAGAVAWAISYRSPGNGIWNTVQVREFTGVIHARPYAMIRIVEGKGPPRTLLLVQEGKRGAAEIGAAFDGQAARVRGHVLERDGRRILELAEPTRPISLDQDTIDSLTFDCKSMGPITLSGEIIDPKCYFGAMKPGEGKVHKECATLCIAGGIPPMFLVRHPGTEPDYYLLADPSGRAADRAILPYVADSVEVAGEVESCDDLLILRLNVDSIRRR